MLNYNYAKLTDGYPTYAPNPIVLTEPIEIDGVIHPAGATLFLSGTAESHYAQLGYKPVQRTESPVKEGYCYTDSWIEQDGVITNIWTEHEEEATTADYIEALTELGVINNDTD